MNQTPEFVAPEWVPPDLTIHLLQELCQLARAHFETDKLIIAGGAPRDILHGKHVKDIDIFLQVGEEDLEGGAALTPVAADFDTLFDTPVAESAPVLEGASKFTRNCRSFAEAINGEVKFRTGPESYGGLADLCDIKTASYPVQIIALYQNPIDDVHNYDFGLSQVFVTPTGPFFTDKYARDAATHCITYLPNNPSEAQVERSRQRLARLREKYGNWSFVDTSPLTVQKEGS